MIEWNKHFDHIYCINFIKYKDRHDAINAEFERIGIDTNADYFSWKYTIDSPFYDELLDSSSFVKDTSNPWWDWKNNKSLIRCAMGHYSVMKEALERGYKHILIFEDDMIFMKDANYIEKAINNIPNDYNIILFDKFICLGYNNYTALLSKHSYNDYYTEWGLYNEYLASLGFYAIDDVFMKHLVECQENKFCPSDHYINNINHDNYKRYFSIINLGVQKEYSPDKNYFEAQYKKLGIKRNWYNY